MKNLLINPFVHIAGWNALFAGLVFMLLGTFTAWFGYARYDGVLDLHYTHQSGLMYPLIDQLVNWGSLTVVFYLVSMAFQATHTRLIDIAGTMLLAKAPYTILPLFNIGNYFNLYLESIINNEVSAGPGGIILIGLISIASVGLIVWSVTLMFQAFKTSTNLKSGKLAVAFILGIVIAEIVSKVVLIRGGFL